MKLKNFMGVYLWGPFAEGYIYIYIYTYIYIYICMYIFIYFFGGEREGKGEEMKGMAHIQYFSLFFIILKA